MLMAYIGLGSNLNDPIKQIKLAIAALTKLPLTLLKDYSNLYWSNSILPKQPCYCNAVAAIMTTLTPQALLTELLAIEIQQGRVRLAKWEARILDLDIILYGNQIINTEHLIIPHPELTKRDFWIRPLVEIAPDLTFLDTIVRLADFLTTALETNLQLACPKSKVGIKLAKAFN